MAKQKQLLSFASLCIVLGTGCGGGGASSSIGGSGGSGGVNADEHGTAKIDVDVQTGAVKVTELGSAGDKHTNSLYTSQSISVTSSTLASDNGEITLKRLKLTFRNNTVDTISNARLIVDRVSTDSGSDPLDLRQFANVTTAVGPGSGPADGPATSVTISQPSGIARGSDGTIYLAGTSEGVLRRWRNGLITQIAGGLSGPGGLDTLGPDAYVIEQGRHRLARVPLDGGTPAFLAGDGSAGLSDGTGTAARFNSPRDIEILGTTAYVSDTLNDRIRVVTNLASASATVATLSLSPQIQRPSGLASVTLNGVTWLVVTSAQDHSIYLVNLSTSTPHRIAGTGAASSTDGMGTIATFSTPFDVVVSNGAIFVSDLGGRRIRQMMYTEGALPHLASSWKVKTIAGNGADGVIDGLGTVARFGSPRFLETHASGALLVSDLTNNRTRLITSASGVLPIMGGGIGGGPVAVSQPDGFIPDPTNSAVSKPFFEVGNFGPSGEGGDSQEETIFFAVGSNVKTFSFIVSLTGESDAPAVLDAVSNTTLPFLGSINVNVRTVAGRSFLSWMDGQGTTATFGARLFVASSEIGTFVSDHNNATIRFVDLTGRVFTIAGLQGITGNGLQGGTGATCSFEGPTHLWSNPLGTELFVTDTLHHAIARVARLPGSDPTQPSSWTISVVAGNPGVPGNQIFAGGTARFREPAGICADPEGRTVYVADLANQCIKFLIFSGRDKTNRDHWFTGYYAGSTTGVAGDADALTTSAQFRGPNGLVLTGNGDVYVAERDGFRVRRINTEGRVSRLAGSATASSGLVDGSAANARFQQLLSITSDESGYLYVSEGRLIRRVSTLTGEVRTVAGSSNVEVPRDGSGNSARLGADVTIDHDPRRGIVEGEAGRIRVIERVIRKSGS